MGYIYDSYKLIKQSQSEDEERLKRDKEKQDEEAIKDCATSLQSEKGGTNL